VPTHLVSFRTSSDEIENRPEVGGCNFLRTSNFEETIHNVLIRHRVEIQFFCYYVSILYTESHCKVHSWISSNASVGRTMSWEFDIHEIPVASAMSILSPSLQLHPWLVVGSLLDPFGLNFTRPQRCPSGCRYPAFIEHHSCRGWSRSWKDSRLDLPYSTLTLRRSKQ